MYPHSITKACCKKRSMSSQFSILTRGTRARRQGSWTPLPGRFPTKVIRRQGQNQTVGSRVPDSDIEKSLYWQPPNFRIHYLLFQRNASIWASKNVWLVGVIALAVAHLSSNARFLPGCHHPWLWFNNSIMRVNMNIAQSCTVVTAITWSTWWVCCWCFHDFSCKLHHVNYTMWITPTRWCSTALSCFKIGPR